MGWEGGGGGSWGCGSGCICAGGDLGVVSATGRMVGCMVGCGGGCEVGCKVGCAVGLVSVDGEDENQPIVVVLWALCRAVL
jgi:hypothetical protein